MSNALTGDFEAILQVSGSTINRLLASMHQNAFATPTTPTFPHVISMRIGDDEFAYGHQGWLQGQLGVPQIALIDGAYDRFHLEVSVRGRYRADPGSKPIADFIHGTVHADYQMVDVPRNCYGWAGISHKYMWFRVVRDSVRFDGTVDNQRSDFMIASVMTAAQEAEALGRVTRLITLLLATKFDPNPKEVGPEFHRGSIRSLNFGGGNSAVVAPIAIGGGTPVGDLASVGQIHLANNDLAIAISRDVILAGIRPYVDALGSYSTTVHFHYDDWVGNEVNVTWGVKADVPTIKWIAGTDPLFGNRCVLAIHTIVRARTEWSALDMHADVDLLYAIDIDFATNHLTATPLGAPKVDLHLPGWVPDWLDWIIDEITGSDFESRIESSMSKGIAPYLPAVAHPLPDLLSKLNKQLKELDDGASAALFDREFTPDGVVLRGPIRVSNRKAADVSFVMTAEQDGFSAVSSWIPGGRIDRLKWSWIWPNGSKHNATNTDRFVLHRPLGSSDELQVRLRGDLPGLDGSGRVCLQISGMRINAVSGFWEPVDTRVVCDRFGFWFGAGIEADSLRLRDMPELSQDVPFPQLSLRAADQASTGANTLVVYAGERLDDDTAETLRRSIRETERDDAGLAVLVLFREGTLTTDSAMRLASELDDIRRDHGRHVAINEDVGGGWARTLAIPTDSGEPAWRLMSPRGGVTWMLDGRAANGEVAAGLADALLPSGPARFTTLSPKTTVGEYLGSGILDLIDEVRADAAVSKCPPGFGPNGVNFYGVATDSLASDDALRGLVEVSRRQGGAGGTAQIVVVDGVDSERAQALMERLGVDLPAIGDPTGAIARRLGIRVWPSVVSVDAAGFVHDIVVEPPADRRVGTSNAVFSPVACAESSEPSAESTTETAS